MKKLSPRMMAVMTTLAVIAVFVGGLAGRHGPVH